MKKNGWKYAVFRSADGSPSYGKIDLAALSNGEDDVPVEDVYGQVFTWRTTHFPLLKLKLFTCASILHSRLGKKVCFLLTLLSL